jgi:hypothetical protein
MALLEGLGYQFLKDKGGWACYCCDTRVEVANTRHRYLGDAVWLAEKQLGALA